MNSRLLRGLTGLAMLALSVTVASADSPLRRVEPAFWWAGMHNPRLQLMVHGDNIAGLEPGIDYAGVRIEQVIKVPNPNYLFIDLLLVDNATPATFDIRFREGENIRATYSYRLLPRTPGSATREGFSPADVLYLVTPDRFINGSPGNDNVAGMREKANRKNPGGRHGGDIEGLIRSLDYIKDMGFTAIWVNPVLENDQASYSYHGYSITDFYKVDARFGANEDYLRLSELARQKGIKQIMDMIMNHCGSEHWWVKDPPTPDWINFGNRFVPTNHRRTTIQDPHASQWDISHFADGWFVATMPDLNQRNPLLATYLIQNSIWWVEYADLAGIRMDTYPYPDKDFMRDWTCALLAEYPNLNIVGEEWSENPAIVAHWQRGKTNPNGYTSCLPSLMDFPLQGALRRALTEEESWSDGWTKLYEMLGNDFLYADAANLVVFPDNHDMSRFFTQVGEDVDLFRLGMTYTLTTRGIPQIYYGTEVLMKNPGTTDHGVIRSDFPGGWPGDAANALTGEGLSGEQRQAQAFVRTLLNWRKDQPAIHAGRMLHYAPEDGVYVYFRYTPNDRVMVVLNKNEQDRALDLTRFAEGLAGATRGKDALSGTIFSLENTLTAPARAPLVLKLE